MPTEIEAKFRLTDPGRVRQRLRQLGGRPVSRVLEINHVFDTPDRRLLRADCGLRIRECRPLDAAATSVCGATPALLTYKGPRDAVALKSREEIETPLQDSGALISIFERLGFREVIVYEKRRETWQVGRCEVALDELPRLGWWVEIEGPDGAVVEDAGAQVGLADTPPVRETYVEMAATHGDTDNRGCRHLVFHDHAGSAGRTEPRP